MNSTCRTIAQNDSDEVRRMKNIFIIVILKNGKNGSISMPGSVSMNKHVCSKRYELSNVSVRCGTHFFIHLRILWIPKSQQGEEDRRRAERWRTGEEQSGRRRNPKLYRTNCPCSH